jgi:hypothetical protein
MPRLASHAPEPGAAPNTGADSTPVADLADTLVAQLSSNDGRERFMARKALVRLGKPAVAPLLAALHNQHDHNRQWEAAMALCEMAEPRSAPALVAALEDPSFDIRWLAAEGLIRLQRAALPSLLPALIAHPESARLRGGAHHVLCAFSASPIYGLLTPLLAALEHGQPELAVPPAAKKVLQELRKAGTGPSSASSWEP